MTIEFCGGGISGTAEAPSSKSATHRAVFMSAMCSGRTVIRRPLVCRDTEASIDAVRRFGASAEFSGGDLMMQGGMQGRDTELYCGNSGTTLRFAIGMASLLGNGYVLTGDASLSERPVGPLLDALESIGAECGSRDGRCPVRIRGPVSGGRTEVDGSISSQFVSSLLMAAPLMPNGLDLETVGDRTSSPYIGMTVRMMRERGIDIRETENGYSVANGEYHPAEIRIPGDWTAASYILAAGALNGSVTVTGLDTSDLTGDGRIAEVLKDMGADVRLSDGEVTCSRNGRLRAVDMDMSQNPDLFPIMAVLLSTADGTGELSGAPNLRNKETDRIGLVTDMINTLGGDAEATEGGCVIHGRRSLEGGRAEHGGDHRIMMAAAIASLCCEGPVSMDDDGCWNISFPEFPETVSSIGLRFRRCTP